MLVDLAHQRRELHATPPRSATKELNDNEGLGHATLSTHAAERSAANTQVRTNSSINTHLIVANEAVLAHIHRLQHSVNLPSRVLAGPKSSPANVMCAGVF